MKVKCLTNIEVTVVHEGEEHSMSTKLIFDHEGRQTKNTALYIESDYFNTATGASVYSRDLVGFIDQESKKTIVRKLVVQQAFSYGGVYMPVSDAQASMLVAFLRPEIEIESER